MLGTCTDDAQWTAPGVPFITCAWLAKNKFCQPSGVYSCPDDRFGQCQNCRKACGICAEDKMGSTSSTEVARRAGKGTARTTEAIFTDIYRHKRWTDATNAGKGSGAGSTVVAAQGASHILTHLALTLNVTSMLDAPCGAMAWQESMIGFLHHNLPGYTFHGIDVVASVVAANTAHFAGKGMGSWATFSQADLVDEPLVKRGGRIFDLAFCRDALMHNIEKDVWLMLYNLANAARYVALGSYGCSGRFPRRGKCSNHPVNRPVGTRNATGATGGFFVIDLMKAPYALTPWTTFSENDPTNKVFYVFRQAELLSQLRERIPSHARRHLERDDAALVGGTRF